MSRHHLFAGFVAAFASTACSHTEPHQAPRHAGSPGVTEVRLGEEPARGARRGDGKGPLWDEFHAARHRKGGYGPAAQQTRELDELTALLDLYPRTQGDPALREKLAIELVDRARPFAQAHLGIRSWSEPRAAELERRFGAWFADNLRSWDPGLQLRAFEWLFLPIRKGEDDARRWPGLDRFALGWALIDSARGHLATLQDGLPPSLEGAAALMCLRDDTPRRSRVSARCRDAFWQFSLASPERRGQLAQALRQRNDGPLTAAVFRSLAVVESQDSEMQLQLIQAIEPSRDAWLAAMKTLAESDRSYSMRTSDEPNGGADLAHQVEEAQRIWVHHPNDRGRRAAALYLLASLDRYDRGHVAWAKFKEQFGAPMQPEEYAAFLAIRPARAVPFAHVPLPALAARTTPADALAQAAWPSIHAYLESSEEARGVRGAEYSVMLDFVSGLCERKRHADVKAIGLALDAYQKSKGRQMFGDLPNAWRERDCSPKTPTVRDAEPAPLPAASAVPEAPRNKVQLVPTAGSGTQQVGLQPAR